MFWNITTTSLVILGALVFYRLAPSILRAFKRFDDENRSRIEDELRDRHDRLAHFRHTLGVAEEQVEDIVEIFETDPRTGTPVKRFVFEGQWYSTRNEAEKVRAEKVGAIARGFYRDLPAALAARKSDGKLGRE